MYLHLPKALQDKIGQAVWEENNVGMSNAHVYKLIEIAGGGNAFLKTVRALRS